MQYYKKIRAKSMQNTAQQFLTYYNSLTVQTQSKQANRKLLQLQQSSQSWQIAKQLLCKPQHMQYGFQLLSKKLNRPYTKQMESKIHLSDTFKQLHQCNNKTMYFCIAKFVLHMAFDRVDVCQMFQPKQVLGVLGEVPNAAAVISLYPLGKQEDDNQRKRAQNIFNNYKQYLTQAFPSYPQQVLQCLQNFSSNNYKLNSQPLLKLLLQLPLPKISTTLQTILLQQKIPSSLYNTIYQYLLSSYNENNIKQFYTVFLAFIRSIDILLLQPTPLTAILTKLLDIIRIENNVNGEDKRDCHFISDSMEFWIQVGGKIKKLEKDVGEGVIRGNQSSILEILRSSFVEMWNIVIQRCFMSQMPKFQTNSAKHQQIVIDSDEDDFESNLNLFNHNPIARLGIQQRVRQTGQQLLHLIFTTIQSSPTHKNQCLSQLYNLSKSPNPLNLQLSIFGISSIADSIRINCIEQINMIILEIAKNSNAKDPYIWQQLIKFIGKLGNQAVCHGGIFTTVLVVVKESIGIEELGVLVGQSFNQILGTCSNGSEVDKQTPILQQLFTYLHSTIYFSTTNQNLFNLLTKSTILFIYYFNRNLDYFKNFLTALNQKIESLKQLEDRYDVIQNLALSHLYVRDQCSQPFAQLFSEFLAAFLPVAFQFISKCPRIKLAGVFNQFGTIVGTGSGYYTDVWSQCVLQLTNLSNVQDEKHLLIQIFNKLLTASQKDEKTYKKYAANFAQKVEPYVTNSLINATQDCFKLIVKALNFHFIVLSNYVQFIPNYNPDPVIDFILANIIRGGMKFEYESSRTGAAILVNVIERNYRVQQILEEVLRAYPKLVNYLWKSLQTILAQAYKKGGKQVYRAAFANVYPSLLPPNPLFDSLVHAISESRSKDYKNLLQVLK